MPVILILSIFYVVIVKCSGRFKKSAWFSMCNFLHDDGTAPSAGSSGVLLRQQVQETGREEQTASVKLKQGS